jgi:hypothetical protein
MERAGYQGSRHEPGRTSVLPQLNGSPASNAVARSCTVQLLHSLATTPPWNATAADHPARSICVQSRLRLAPLALSAHPGSTAGIGSLLSQWLRVLCAPTSGGPPAFRDQRPGRHVIFLFRAMARKATKGSPMGTATSKHIVLLDHNVSRRQLIRETLEDLGYRVSLVPNASMAQRVIARGDVSLLIADTDVFGVPCVLISSGRKRPDTTGVNAVALIDKPFTLKRLGSRVYRMLASQRGPPNEYS